MEWQFALTIMVVALVGLMLSGLPIGVVFMLLTLGGAIIYWGNEAGISQFILNMRSSVSRFSLLPIAMFVLLGEVMFHSGMGMNMLDAIGKWLGRLPGRLGLLAVAFSTLFATMSGSSVSTAALMGAVLKPEMEARGYQKAISIGAIMGAGGLAIVIPPSSLAVLIGAIGKISIGRLLIAGFIPGLMMSAFYAAYVIGRCWLQPSVAPPYEVTVHPLSEKVKDTMRYVVPLGLIIFLVLGLIFVGVATPTESAAMGTVGSLFLAACYRRLNWQLVKKSVMGTLRIAVMVYLIITFALTFSQIMAFSGVTQGLTEWVVSLPLSPMMVIVGIMLVVGVMGCFMEVAAIIMISLPIFMPIVNTLGFDPVWFGIIFLINLEMALTTPPFGMLLFVMKGVSPPDTTMGDIIRAGLPFLLCDTIVITLIILFPIVTLWLPNMMLKG